MSRHPMFAAALPTARWLGPTVVKMVDNNPSAQTLSATSGYRRRIGHRLFLMLVLVWAIMVSLSAGVQAQTGASPSETAKPATTKATAVALPLSDVAHLARRETAPELQVAAWVDQSGPVTAPVLSGKIQLVVFWGVNCPACVRKIPKVREVAKRYNDSDLVVIGLHNAHISPQRVAKFVRDRGLNYPIAVDRSAKKRASWGMTTSTLR